MLTPEEKIAQLQAEMERTFSREQIVIARENLIRDLQITAQTLSLYVQVAREEGDVARAAYFTMTLHDIQHLHRKGSEEQRRYEERLEQEG